MLASIQILVHLSIFLMIVSYKQRCGERYYRVDAGLLAFAIAGFNIAMVGYLILTQPSHAGILDYLFFASSVVVLGVVLKFKGSTARMIDWALKKPVG